MILSYAQQTGAEASAFATSKATSGFAFSPRVRISIWSSWPPSSEQLFLKCAALSADTCIERHL